MKILTLLLILVTSVSVFAQKYSDYFNEGKKAFNKGNFMPALQLFDLAYEIAKTDDDKIESHKWKNITRDSIKQQSSNLVIARDNALREQKEAERQKAIADTARAKADTLRNISLAKSLAFQAIKLHQDNLKSTTSLKDTIKELPLILAYWAWYFNDQYKGNPYDPDIFAALSEVSNTNIKKEGDSFHTDIIRDIVFSNSGKLFFTCSDDGSVKKFVSPDSLIFEHFQKINPVNMNISNTEKIYYFRSLVFSPDEKWIAAGTYQGDILVWDIENNKSPIHLETTNPENQSASKSVNKLIALKNPSRFISISNDGYLSWWNIDDFINTNPKDKKAKVLGKFKLINGEKLSTLAVNDDASLLAVASESGMVRILNSTTLELKDSLPGEEKTKILSLCWDNKGNLIVGFESGKIEIRNGKTSISPPTAHDSGITDIHFDSDSINNINRMITSSYDGKIALWNYDNIYSEPAIIKGHSSWVSCLALSKGNSMVLSGSADKSILISKINIQELKEIIRSKIRENENMSRKNWEKYVSKDLPYEEKLPENLKAK